MCNLELSEVLASTNYMKSLGLVRFINEHVGVTNACLKLMLGRLSKSKRRFWIVVKCREGYEDLLKSMGFIGQGTTLFAPLMRLMINEVGERCDVIIACTSKMLSELWKLKVGSLTPWSSLFSSIEARDRALRYLKFKERGFVYAVETSVRKLIEAFIIARDLSSVFDLHFSLEVLRKELGIDFSPLLEVIEGDPLIVLSILDEGIERCKSYLERCAATRRSHPRFKDLEDFELNVVTKS